MYFCDHDLSDCRAKLEKLAGPGAGEDDEGESSVASKDAEDGGGPSVPSPTEAAEVFLLWMRGVLDSDWGTVSSLSAAEFHVTASDGDKIPCVAVELKGLPAAKCVREQETTLVEHLTLEWKHFAKTVKVVRRDVGRRCGTTVSAYNSLDGETFELESRLDELQRPPRICLLDIRKAFFE